MEESAVSLPADSSSGIWAFLFLLSRLEAVDWLDMLQYITWHFKHRKDVIERFASHRTLIYRRHNDIGLVDTFHLLPEFIHRECFIGCLPWKPSANSMRCRHIVISIAFASADQSAILHRYRYEDNLFGVCPDDTLLISCKYGTIC